MTIHILTNISRSKDNQAMKFDQSIEHKMRNIFYTQNVVKKLVPDPILKVEIEDIFGSKVYLSLRIQTTCFYLM